jgi:methylated-DNA-[protein]-cysteine S-methyltransferase
MTPIDMTELARRAAEEGILDVAYATVDAPFGRMLVAATPTGLVRTAFDKERTDDVLTELSARISPRVLEAPARLDGVRRELDEYFDGRRHEFDLPLDVRVAPFHEEVLRELARVPYGQVDTYGHLAALVGRPKAARAVGTVMNRNPIPIVLPCHRIVGANGSLTGYGGGLPAKKLLLELEGATLPF